MCSAHCSDGRNADTETNLVIRSPIRGKRKWEFCTENEQLFRICDVKIHRHMKIRGDTNPYIDVEYYVERKSKHKYEHRYRDKSFAT